MVACAAGRGRRRGARAGTRDAVVDHVLLRDDALADAALQKDGVVLHQRLVLVDELGQALHEVAAFLDPAVGQVVAQAAEAEVIEHHARTADLFEEVEDVCLLYTSDAADE